MLTPEQPKSFHSQSIIHIPSSQQTGHSNFESLSNEDLTSSFSDLTNEDLESVLSECSLFHSHQAETPQVIAAGTPGLVSPEQVMVRFPGRSIGTLRKLTIELALQCVFGEEVMATSTISGRNNTAQFDQDKLSYIKTLVLCCPTLNLSRCGANAWNL